MKTQDLLRLTFRLLSLALFAGAAQAADVRVYMVHAAGQRAAAEAALRQAGGRPHHVFDNLNALAVTIPEQARVALERNPAVALVEEDPVRGFLGQVTPYGVTLVAAPSAVSSGATGAGIKVGVIDSGVFTGHEDFAGVAITGEPYYTSGDSRNWNRDFLAHGTHVVGTIAAANNSAGVIGVSPGAVSIHMVKVFGDTGGWVYSSDLLAACRAARTAGAKIISMSLGGSGSSTTESNGMADLYTNSGILLVAAAGNGGSTAVSYPAGYSSVMSVAAINSGKGLASFSQRNSDVEIAAPGVAVLSTVPYRDTVTVAANGSTIGGNHVDYSARGTATGTLVYGGLGDTTNPAWSGKIVLVDRGTVSFLTKVQNVAASGGLACVIANNVDGSLLATLSPGSAAIPAVGVSQADGAALKLLVNFSATVTSLHEDSVSGYDYFDGTSMATPHVSGVAALIWSKYPAATAAQVRQALTTSAEDLGVAGRDSSFGYGLVRADLALAALAVLMVPPPADTTPPVISNLKHTVTSTKNATFDITWVTNEPATSDVVLNGKLYPDPDPTRVTNHRRSFRTSRNLTNTYSVSSQDAAGNTATATGVSFVIR